MLKENNLTFFKELESLTRKYSDASMKVVDFDSFTALINEVTKILPAQSNAYLGNFNVSIVGKKGSASFLNLKPTASQNADLCGFSLNHYHNHFKGCPKSAFFDGEDVCIDIWRKDFISAATYEEKGIIVLLKSGTITIGW